MFTVMTIREIHRHYFDNLKAICSEGEATAITDIIFRHFLHLTRSQIIVRGNEELSKAWEHDLEMALEKLMLHIPVQYVTGVEWFCDLPFAVNEDVLIPRPETEELVRLAVDFLRSGSNGKVLDIGTGSGCIPISLKKAVPGAEIISVDISPGALVTAKQNAETNQVDVTFLQMDFLAEASRSSLGIFDVIISNPPYIPDEEKTVLDKNVVMHEPHVALFVPQHDPLIFYKRIQEFAEEHLTEKGKIFLEVHEHFAAQTASLFPEERFRSQVVKDISGKERMVVISRYL